MATKKGIDALAFVKAYLTKKKEASFAEVRDAGKAVGHLIHPIVYGRTQLLLGHVKAGKKKAAKKAPTKKPAAKASRAAPARRGPGRPRKVAAEFSGLDGIVAHVREIERERDQLRAAIEKMRALLSSI